MEDFYSVAYGLVMPFVIALILMRFIKEEELPSWTRAVWFPRAKTGIYVAGAVVMFISAVKGWSSNELAHEFFGFLGGIAFLYNAYHIFSKKPGGWLGQWFQLH